MLTDSFGIVCLFSCYLRGQSLSLPGFQQFQLTMKSSCCEKDDIVWKDSKAKPYPLWDNHLGCNLISAKFITHHSAESIASDMQEGSFLLTMLSGQSDRVLLDKSTSCRLWLTSYLFQYFSRK